MSARGFGRYLTDEYRAQTLGPDAAQRRAEEHARREQCRADERARRRQAREVESVARQIADDKATRNDVLARRETSLDEIERCGRGFGRYLA